MNLQCMERLPGALAKEFPAVELPAGFTITPEQCPEGMEGDGKEGIGKDRKRKKESSLRSE